ncbi:sulfite exporter TauE/SafE family protein [Halobellus ordinarius]|uniref:sulfite exporter TauE/SafE family protein n=1 Tax=Halobellus ordinarius TaxID=3075120 RepID=UPI002880A8B6|nr:sulfite exporter TauE/SafE family protein [Halobellus sp. ZY16]
MIVTATPTTIAIVTAVVLVAGATNGVAGFGFAVVGTMALATMIDPATAVVFMIVPIFAVNLSLVSDLSRRELRTCSRRFWPLIGAALVGTVVGMAVLGRIPEAPLRVGLGVLTLGFVLSAQKRVPLPAWTAVGSSDLGRSRAGMFGVGAVSGLLFGGTNVGVQLIAYLRSFDLSHGLFVGVVALVFLGLNGIRVVVAGVLGLYPSSTVAAASLAAALPAVAGVAVGKRFRSRISARARRFTVLGLLTVVGLRLVTGGLGIP